MKVYAYFEFPDSEKAEEAWNKCLELGLVWLKFTTTGPSNTWYFQNYDSEKLMKIYKEIRQFGVVLR